MSDDNLWGRDDELRAKPGPGAPRDDDGPHDQDDDLGARVDELFTTAVERQVAEQRNLNRLLTGLEESVATIRSRIDELQSQIARDLAPSADRIATLDATIRQLRETGSQQYVALRAEIGETFSELRDETRTRTTEVAQELAGLRDLEAKLEDRLEQLATAVAASADRMETRQGDAAADLTRLSAQVTEAIEATEAAREGLGPLSAQLSDELEARENRLASAVADLRRLVEPLHQDLSAGLEPLRDELASTVEPLRRQLAELQERSGGMARTATDAVEDAVDQLSTLVGQLRNEVSERLADHQRQVTSAVEELVGRQTRSIEEALSRRDATLAARDEELRASLAEREEELRTVLAGQVQALAARVGDELSGLDELGVALTRSRSLEEEAREALRRDLVTAIEEGLGEQVGHHLSRVSDRVEVGLAGLRARMDEQLDRVTEALREDADTTRIVTADLRQQLLAEVAETRETTTEIVESLRDGVREELRVTGGRMDEALGGVRSTVDAALGGQSERLEDAVEALRTTVSETLEHGVAAQTDRVDELVRDLGDQLGHALGSITDRFENALGVLDARVGESLDQVAVARQRLDELQASVAQSSADLGQQADAMTSMNEQLGLLGDTVAGEMAQARESMVSEQRAVMAELADLLTGAEERLAGARQLFENEAAGLVERGQQLEDRLEAALEEVVEDTRVHARSGAHKLASSAEQLDEIFVDLRQLESTLVAQLEARERQLVEERVHLLRDLVEQLAGSLSKRERRKLAAKLDVPTPPPRPVRPVDPLEGTPPLPRDVRPVPADGPAETAPPRPSRAPAPSAPPTPAGGRPVRRKPVARKVVRPSSSATSGDRRTVGKEAVETLAQVKGLGPAKAEQLLDAFGSYEAVVAATPAELEEVRGIGGSLAASIHEQLNG